MIGRYKKLVANVNQKLRNIENAGYTFDSAYQQAIHSMERLSVMKTKSGRFSSSGKFATEKNIKIMENLSRRLDMTKVKTRIQNTMIEEGLTFEEAVSYMQTNALFDKVVSKMPKEFYESSQVSEILRNEFDSTPTYEELLTKIMESGDAQAWYDISPSATKELFEEYARISSDFEEGASWEEVAERLGVTI